MNEIETNNFNQLPQPKKLAFLKKPVFWAIIIAVLIIATAVFVFLKPTKISVPEAVILEEAPKGQLLVGVPSGLIVDPNAVITGSAENQINNPETQLLVSSYNTRLTGEEIEAKYKEFFTADSWQILQTNKIGNQLSIVAMKDAQNMVSISFFQKDGEAGNLVVVSLYKKK